MHLLQGHVSQILHGCSHVQLRLTKPNVHYRTYNSPLLILTPYLFKVHFNIILPCMTAYP
jgi:hypothetical protein